MAQSWNCWENMKENDPCFAKLRWQNLVLKLGNQRRTIIKFSQDSLRVFDSLLEPEAELLSWCHLGRGDSHHTAHLTDSEGRA